MKESFLPLCYQFITLLGAVRYGSENFRATSEGEKSLPIFFICFSIVSVILFAFLRMNQLQPDARDVMT